MDNGKEIKLGNIYGFTGGNYAGNVYDKEGISPCLSTFGGGNQQPMIVETEKICVAMRGRPTEGSDYSGETEQRLEPNFTGATNTLTSVAKDNLVLEQVTEKKDVHELGFIDHGTGKHQSNTVYATDGISPAITTVNGGGTQQIKICEVTEEPKPGRIKIKQPNSKGYAECKIGGVFDANYATSTTRRGRVQEGGDICPTICAENQEICRIENGSPDDYTLVYEDGEYIYYIKIRKLTPRECWRLMDFKDRDFDRAQDVNSNTQLYKQAGNSIVKNVLVAIIGQMFEGCENRYKENIKHEQR